MQSHQQRETITFIAVVLGLFVAYHFLFIAPAQKRAEQAAKEKAAAAAKAPGLPGAPTGVVFVERAEALAATPRVKIETPAVSGSLSLVGAKIDDLFLKGYRETLSPNSPPVELFRPERAKFAYFAETGWAGVNLPGIPGRDTVWTLSEGDVLSPGKPVTLTYDNGLGLKFTRRISIDERFLFTIEDTVANLSAGPVTLTPYGSVQRQGLANPKGASGVHEGAIGVFDRKLKLRKYRNWKKDGRFTMTSTGGWLGVTDKYWMAGLLPPQDEPINAAFQVAASQGIDVYEANFLGRATIIPAGKQTTHTTHLFAGAKVVPVLRDYQEALKVPRLEDAVDWGWDAFYFIPKTIFWMLSVFYGWVSNFGLAILMLTVVVKAIFFYPANLSYASMTKMKKVQPQVEELRARLKEDPPAMQKEMLALYQREKINPLMGCLPILVSLPVFIGLFHVLNVTIEMRHAPFIGWIADLSARDPSTIWNLFGLIPWDPASLPWVGPNILDGPLHLGVWAIAYGVTMWLTQSMSPPAPDPMQQRILMLMPLIFTFVLTNLAAGLLIYYTWSNLLTIAQQYVIMRRFKVDNPIDKIIRRFTGAPAPEG